MKITVFNGSPRGRKSNTNILVEPFLLGAKKAGADVANVFLVKKIIEHCTGCFGCWTKTPGKCVIDDEMNDLLELFMAADIVVFATPLYVDSVTAMMKSFMDRLIPIVSPYFEKDEQGESRHKKRYEKYPKIVVISNCGYPEDSHFQVLQHQFQRLARNMHTEIVGEIFRSAGELLTQQHPMLDSLIADYKQCLESAGAELVNSGCISQETSDQLKRPLISEDMYISAANMSWDRLLKKH